MDLVHSPSAHTHRATAGPVLDPNIQAWRRDGLYLPEFMRDFHDQKDLFKALHEVVDRRLAADGGSLYMRDLSWIDAHVYTVDIFLWVMAGHGYTLQRSRQKFAFPSIHDFVAAARERVRASLSGLLSAMSDNKLAGDEGEAGVNPTPATIQEER